MSRQQLKLRPSPALDNLIAMSGFPDGPTQRLNRVAERYLELIVACAPEMDENEWFAVRDAVAAEVAEKGGAPGAGYWFALIENRPEVCARHAVDAEALSAKMAAWSTAEEIAAEEMLERVTVAEAA